MGRARKTRKIRQKVLIFCEGTTEVVYLNMLKRRYNAANVSIDVIDTKGKSGIEIINFALGRAKFTKKVDAKIYVLFDKDDKTEQELIRAKNFAKKKNVNVICSNVCFEVWLLLHFRSFKISGHDNWIDRKWLYQQLAREFKVDNYVKDKAHDFNDEYIDRIPDALDNYEDMQNQLALSSYHEPDTDLVKLIKAVFDN